MTGAADVVSRLGALVSTIIGPSRMPASLGPDTRLVTDLWLDSVELVELLLACESEFGITLDESLHLQPASLESLGSLAAVIVARQAVA